MDEPVRENTENDGAIEGPFSGQADLEGMPTPDGSGVTYSLSVDDAAEGTRLDRWLNMLSPLLSRSQIQRWIEADLVQLNGSSPKASHRVLCGDVVFVTIPTPRKSKLEATPFPLDILYEDSDILAVNKPVGLVVHPGAGREEITLVHALLHHCDDLRGVGDELRPGIVHRLDRDTSGVILVAKHDVAHRALVMQFSERQITKEYRALARGVPETVTGQIEGAIGRHPVHRKRMSVVERGGKPALTRYRVLRVWDEISEIQCFPKTGRTHQVRVHLAHLGHPIWGDSVYGGTRPLRGTQEVTMPTRQMLHAHRIQFDHPISGETLDFIAPFPKDWLETVESLGEG